MSVVSVFGTHQNDLDDETEVDIELRIRISKQTAITFTHEGGQEHGGEVGLNVGGEVSWYVVSKLEYCQTMPPSLSYPTAVLIR